MQKLPTVLAAPAVQVSAACLLAVVASGILWASGADVAIQRWLYTNHDPAWDAFWRGVGDFGLGRSQMIICLLVGWIITARQLPRAQRPHSVTLPLWLFWGALWGLLRLYTLRITPLQHTRPPEAFPGYRGLRQSVSDALGLLQTLPRVARGWILALPIMFGAGLLVIIAKQIIGRPRPKEVLWNGEADALLWLNGLWGVGGGSSFQSYPSGHTVTTFALLAVLLKLHPRYAVWWWLAAVMVSSARFLAVTPHYVGDVLAGAALGFGVGWFLTRRFRVFSGHS